MDIWRYTRTGAHRYTAVPVQVHSYTQTGAAAQSGRHDRGVMGRTLDPRPCPSQLAMPCLSPSSNFSSYISFPLSAIIPSDTWFRNQMEPKTWSLSTSIS